MSDPMREPEHEAWAELTDRELLGQVIGVLEQVERELPHQSLLWAEVATMAGHVRRRYAALSTTPSPLDYGLASIVAQYLRLDDALPDEKPDTMPTPVWDARVREVNNARAGINAFLAKYNLAP